MVETRPRVTLARSEIGGRDFAFETRFSALLLIDGRVLNLIRWSARSIPKASP